MKRLFLIRGLPGSGKSTLAEVIAWGCNALYTKPGEQSHEVVSVSTDDSFMYLSGAWKMMVDLIRQNPGDERANDLLDVYQTPKAGYREEGKYHFVPEFLKYAHGVAQNRVQDAMLDDEDYQTIIVHNTFSQPWEANVYKVLAEAHGYHVFVIECQNSFANTHNVPRQSIDAMKARWLPL